MRITITGSLGNISKPLAEILVKNGHDVTLISRDANKIDEIQQLGAKPAIGSVSDVDFLTHAFNGADAIYTMVPPNMGASNYREYMAQTGKSYRDAILASGVKHVVNLSSIGAHLSEGTGPIAGLYEVEQTLNSLDGVAVKHLRAGIFYINFFFDIPIIQAMGIIGSNYGSHTPIVLVHPRDIAEAAAQELQSSIQDKSYRYVVSQEAEITDVVKVLGSSIGKPDLAWSQFSDEELLAGMLGAGMSPSIAGLYVEMGRAIGSGMVFEDFRRHVPTAWGATKLDDFAQEFAAVYSSIH